MENNKLAVIVLGKRNAGKSNTWYEFFGRTVRTGWKSLSLEFKTQEIFLKNSSFEETGAEIDSYVFVRNASFEEWGDEAPKYFKGKKFEELPQIIFCSVQYVEKGKKTISWFKDNGYYLYIHWLNPGYSGNEYDDSLNFEAEFKKSGEFVKISGKEKKKRTKKIVEFLKLWFK